ncbi:MAG: hypothetical protein HOV81_16280 [Kofleriaceae bacterium]|nr:hypothetical protein [Kofleriaceae bacterium]
MEIALEPLDVAAVELVAKEIDLVGERRCAPGKALACKRRRDCFGFEDEPEVASELL